jgi:2-C-methyl-D-erythritol 4-phosphate cytidylyltransferase
MVKDQQETATGLIVAAGQGLRMGTTIPKVLLPVGGRPLLAHTLQAFEQAETIDRVVLVAAEDQLALMAAEVIDGHRLRKVRQVIPGGARRQDSVRLGLEAVGPQCRLVAIHDGARPLITAESIDRVVTQAARHEAAALAVRPSDTVRRGDGKTFQVTLDRDKLWLMQTPQVFSCDLILSAHRRAAEQGLNGTDDVSLVEAMGHQVRVVEGLRENIKVTTPEDLLFVEAVLSRRSEA